jgi:hypothetical protein
MYRTDVPEREEDIPLFFKTMASKVVERQFNKEVSVFKAWRQDTPASLNQAFNEDIKHWKGYRFIKQDEERIETEGVLKKHFARLKHIFIHCCAGSSFPYLTSLDFADFAIKSKMPDNIVNLSTLDRTFIAANLKVDAAASTDGSNGLCRFEFLEILVRLANIKYLETKIVKSFTEAAEKLISECVIHNFLPESWQEFRDKELWTIDVNDVLEANLDNLKKIYASYITQVHKSMDLQDCIKLCTVDSPLQISEKDICFAYGMCKMTVVNEEKFKGQYSALQFVEFLEFVGRIAFAKFKNASGDMQS